MPVPPMPDDPIPPKYAPFADDGDPPPYTGTAPPAYGANPVDQAAYRPAYTSDTKGGGTDDSSERSFHDKNLRRDFVIKAYSILSVQLLYTFTILALFVHKQWPITKLKIFDRVFSMDDGKMGFGGNEYVLYLSLAVLVAASHCTMLLAISFCGSCRKFPLHFILLAVLTLTMSCAAGAVAAVSSPAIVLMAVGMTAIVCIGITLTAVTSVVHITKCKYAMYIDMFVIAGWVLCVCGVTITIVIAGFGRGGSPNGYINSIWTIYSAVGCLLFMAYLVFDTQLIMAGLTLKPTTDKAET